LNILIHTHIHKKFPQYVQHHLVVLGVLWVSKVEDDSRVRLSTTTVASVTALGEGLLEVNTPVEAQGTIWKDVNPLSLEIGWGVDNANLASLDEVIGDEEVLLVGRDLDVVRTGDTLVFIRVIETLDVVEVRDVERSDVVAESKSEVGPLAVIRDVRVDGKVVAGLGAEVVKEFSNTTLAIGVRAERVDDPDLAGTNSSSKSSGLRVARNELDVLDTLTIRDSDSGDDLATIEFPQTESVSLLDADGASRLEDGDRDNKVGSQYDLLIEVDGQTMGRELLAEDVEGRLDIFWPFVDDVEVGISLNETTWRSTNSSYFYVSIAM
jgi:hypothetical protein